jgi:hypothetical protein
MDQWCKAFKESLAGVGIAGAVLSGAVALDATAHADEFEAFTWARHHPAATEHVNPLIQLDPWVDLADVARRLKELPAGKRFVVFQWMTDDLADHPSDRVVTRTWELRPTTVPATRSSSRSTAKAGPVMASSGRAPASAVAASSSKSTAASTVMTRVAVDRPTPFRGPWMDAGIAMVRARVHAAMQRLKALGAPIDGVAIDNETTLHAANFLGTPGSLAAIEQDPRWPSLAASMGLPVRVSDMFWGSPSYYLWTERMAARFDAAMNAAAFEPIRRAYPKAVVSNYCTGRMRAAHATPDVNGHPDRSASAGFGTHDNSEFYGWLAPGRVARASGSVSTSESWLAFRVEMHKIRGMNLSSARPKHAWIAARSWQGESWGRVPFAGTPMWDELVIQLGMNGVRCFFELSIEDFGISREENLERRARDRHALNEVMAHLNDRISGASPIVLAARQPTWNDRIVATGRYVGDRVVWRFSFADGVDAVKIQLSDGSDHVVEVEPGRRGAWFEHAADVDMVMDATGRLPSIEIMEPRSAVPAAQ